MTLKWDLSESVYLKNRFKIKSERVDLEVIKYEKPAVIKELNYTKEEIRLLSDPKHLKFVDYIIRKFFNKECNPNVMRDLVEYTIFEMKCNIKSYDPQYNFNTFIKNIVENNTRNYYIRDIYKHKYMSTTDNSCDKLPIISLDETDSTLKDTIIDTHSVLDANYIIYCQLKDIMNDFNPITRQFCERVFLDNMNPRRIEKEINSKIAIYKSEFDKFCEKLDYPRHKHDYSKVIDLKTITDPLKLDFFTTAIKVKSSNTAYHKLYIRDGFFHKNKMLDILRKRINYYM